LVEPGVDVSKKYAIYITKHPTGLFYKGKGITANILAGKYKGSGIRLNLSFYLPEYAWETWTTTVVASFDDEEEAYDAEAEYLPAASLFNPLCLNMKAGGRPAWTHGGSGAGALLKKTRAGEKRAREQKRKLKLKAQKDAERAEVRATKLAEKVAAKLERANNPPPRKPRKKVAVSAALLEMCKRPKSEAWKKQVSEWMSKPITDEERLAFDNALRFPVIWRGNISLHGTAKRHGLHFRRFYRYSKESNVK
jgi:hypothetical protein